jgi:Protein of unknown function (DUF2384)
MPYYLSYIYGILAIEMTVSKPPRSAKTSRRGIKVARKSGVKVGKRASVVTNAPRRPLAAQFLDPKGIVIVDRVAERFGMSKQQFAETIGVKPETVYRSSRVSAPKTQTRATEMLEIVGRIAAWAGGEKQAMAWYRAEPIAAFGDRTAEALVKDGKATAVRDYLDHIAIGGFA